jgi:hypothetical protein
VVTVEQAMGHGLGRHSVARLLSSGQWNRLAVGLYRTLPLAPDWAALAWAGVLLGGDVARLGPQASGYLHNLKPDPPEPIDVLIPAHRQIRVDGPWTFIRDSAKGRSPRSVGSPPRMSVEETVVDLTARCKPGEVVTIVTRAIQARLTTPRRIENALQRRTRHPHRALLIAMVTDVAVGAESALELMYLRDVERAHQLPRGNRQTSRHGLPYRRDVGYEDFGLLVELDGKRGHQGEGRFRDMNRDNLHVLHDELTLRFGFFAVAYRPCRVAFQVYLALTKLGYSEPFVRCRRCAKMPLEELARA